MRGMTGIGGAGGGKDYEGEGSRRRRKRRTTMTRRRRRGTRSKRRPHQPQLSVHHNLAHHQYRLRLQQHQFAAAASLSHLRFLLSSFLPRPPCLNDRGPRPFYVPSLLLSVILCSAFRSHCFLTQALGPRTVSPSRQAFVQCYTIVDNNQSLSIFRLLHM